MPKNQIVEKGISDTLNSATRRLPKHNTLKLERQHVEIANSTCCLFHLDVLSFHDGPGDVAFP